MEDKTHELKESIPLTPLPIKHGDVQGRMYQRLRQGKLVYEQPRYLTWVGIFISLVSGSMCALAVFWGLWEWRIYAGFLVFGLLAIPTDLSTRKNERRLEVDRVKDMISLMRGRQRLWQARTGELVGLQLLYVVNRHERAAIAGPGRRRGPQYWHAYQLNLVWRSDDGVIKRGYIAGWVWKGPMISFMKSLAKELGVEFSDHTDTDVKRAQKAEARRAGGGFLSDAEMDAFR